MIKYIFTNLIMHTLCLTVFIITVPLTILGRIPTFLIEKFGDEDLADDIFLKYNILYDRVLSFVGIDDE